MKSIALFALILVSAQSSAQMNNYFMKFLPYQIKCVLTEFSFSVTYDNNLITQEYELENNIYKKARGKKLELQCENAKRQAAQDGSSVVINIQTTEVLPEKGFLVELNRDAIQLERQK